MILNKTAKEKKLKAIDFRFFETPRVCETCKLLCKAKKLNKAVFYLYCVTIFYYFLLVLLYLYKFILLKMILSSFPLSAARVRLLGAASVRPRCG